MRIAMIGSRGIPARYGGSETCIEEVGARLAARGHEVVAYCRRHNSRTDTKAYRGIRRVVLPSWNRKNFDTPTHSLLSTLHALLSAHVDVVHFHGVGNALFIPMVWLAGKKSVLTVDGPDWTRPKWGPIARFVLYRAATSVAGAANVLITDSPIAFDTYTRLFGKRAVYIPYGASPPASEPGVSALEGRRLDRERYFLYVGRLIPDKGVHFLIDAFTRIPRQRRNHMRLAIIGDNPYFPDYIARLKAMADDDVDFLGYVYGQEYEELLGHAYAYVQPSSVEGTSPSLLAAMAFGRCVVVNGIPENRATIGDAGLWFERDDPASLSDVLLRLINDPLLAADLGHLAQERVREQYDWDIITDQHERLYTDSTGGRGLPVAKVT